MTTYIPAKKGAEFIFYAGLVSQSTGQFQNNPTLAAGDFKVSIDGGALANLATLPAVTPASSRMVKFTLSTSEMNGDNVTVVGVDAAGSEWDEMIVNIQTSAQQIDDLATQASVNTIDDFLDTEITDIRNRLPAALVSGRMDSSVGAMAADTMTASALAADAVTEIQSGLSTLTAAGVRSAVGLASANLDTQLSGIQSDADNIQTRLPAALSGDGFIKADLKSIEDELTSGNNAILKLKQLDIQNNAGTAVLAYAGAGGFGMAIQGSTTGAGLDIRGGANGNGVTVSGGASSGIGINITSPADDAVYIESSGGGSYGMQIISENGNGMIVNGDVVGLEVYGGTDAGAYIYGVDAGLDIGIGKSINAPQDIQVSDGSLTLTNIAKKVLTLDWTTVTSEAARSVLNALRKLRNKVSFNGTTTLTVYKEDGTTSAYTQTVTTDDTQEPFKELGN